MITAPRAKAVRASSPRRPSIPRDGSPLAATLDMVTPFALL